MVSARLSARRFRGSVRRAQGVTVWRSPLALGGSRRWRLRRRACAGGGDGWRRGRPPARGGGGGGGVAGGGGGAGPRQGQDGDGDMLLQGAVAGRVIRHAVLPAAP